MKALRSLALGVAASAALVLSGAGVSAQTIVNGSFETGDFSGWIPLDLTIPYRSLSVQGAGAGPFFPTTPTDGSFAAVTGFDGFGSLGPSGAISLSQDIGILGPDLELAFDYRAGWIIFDGFLERAFRVLLEPNGGGVPLASFDILTASGGDFNPDTGPLTASLDLSPYAGLDVRIRFQWDVPQDRTGPAQAQLDNVRLVSNSQPQSVPGPLPVFAAAAAFAYSRKLRTRIMASQVP
jgi:hypothetical protein